MISILKYDDSFRNGLSAIYKAKKDIKAAIGERSNMDGYHSDSEMIDVLSDFDSRPFYGIKINDLYEFNNGMLVEKKCDDPSKFKAFAIPDKYEPNDSIKNVSGTFLNSALQSTDCISSVSISINSLKGGLYRAFSNCKNLTEATFDIKKWYISQGFFTQKLSSYMFYSGRPSIFHGNILSTSGNISHSLKEVLSGTDGISSISFPQQTVSQMKFLFLETVDHNTDDPDYFNNEHRNYFGVKFERNSPLSVYCQDGCFLYSLNEYLAEMSNPSKTVATYSDGIKVAYDVVNDFKNESINYVGYVEDLKLGNAISSIKENAFGYFDGFVAENYYGNLKSIFFPESIKTIDEDSGLYFIGHSMPNLVPKLSAIDTESISSFLEVKDSNRINTYWDLYNNGNKVTELVYTNGDLYNCRSIERLSTSTGQTSIKNYLYQYCPNISSLTLTEGISQIGNNTNSSLKEINIPSISSWLNIDFSNGILNTDTKLLLNGNLVSSVNVERSTIKPYTFANYSYLQEITANWLTKIGEYAFYNCTNLIGTYMEDAAGKFSNCFGGVKRNSSERLDIEQYAFYNCKKLPYFPSDFATKVSYKAFENAKITVAKDISFAWIEDIKSDAFNGLTFANVDPDTGKNTITINVYIDPNDSQHPISNVFIGQNSFANMDQTFYLTFHNIGTPVSDTLPYIQKIIESETGQYKRYPWGLSPSNIVLA